MSGESVGNRLKKLRGHEPRPDFAERFGVSRNTLARYETNKGQPDAAFLQQVCEAYNINPGWLLLGEGPMYRGEREEEGRREEQAVPEEGRPSAEYGRRESDLALAKGFELLAKIYGSGNQVLIRAIISNLLAFSEAIDNKARAEAAERRMEQLESELAKERGERKRASEEMERRMAALEQRLAEGNRLKAANGNGQ